MRKVVLFIFFLTVQTVLSQSLKPELVKESFHIGEEITVKVALSTENKVSASFAKETKEVAILGAKPDEDGLSVTVRIIALVNGEVNVPQIDLAIDGTVFNIEPFTVTSVSRTVENDTNLRDLKETVKIMEEDYTLLYVLAALLAISAIAFLLIKLRKRFTAKTVSMPVKVDPYEVAEGFIKEARSKRESGDNEAFVDISTLGLKTYMSLLNRSNYTEMTTSEVRRKLKKDSLFSRFSEQILDILKLGDRFKFADEPLSETDFDKLIEGFVEIVRKTKADEVKQNDAA